MGVLMSRGARSVKLYNIENRAHKVISKEPKVAPKYKANVEEMERIKQQYPESYENLLRKDTQLDKHLKDVYVQSQIIKEKQEEPKRALPLNRKPVEEPLYGYEEPEKFSPGKTSLKLALQFISDHQKDPKMYNPEKIALDYNLDLQATKSVLKYFRVFEIYVPLERNVKATFIGPSIPGIRPVENKKLESGKFDDTKT